MDPVFKAKTRYEVTTRFSGERKYQRWMDRVDAGFQVFLRYFRRLLSHQMKYGALRQSTWIKTFYSIKHLNALVRLSKFNYQRAHRDFGGMLSDYVRSSGSPLSFPDFIKGINGGPPGTNFPPLLPQSRHPSDQDCLQIGRGLPGGDEGPGSGNGMPGGPGGLGGLRGPGKSESKEATYLLGRFYL